MGPLRNLGDELLKMINDDIRPIQFDDFQVSLFKIKPSVSMDDMEKYEEWAKRYGERGS